MAEPKTVYNLPLDASIRWSNDQEFLKETQSITSDATLASSLARTDVILPIRLSEFENFLGLSSLHPSWASFLTPPGFTHGRRQIFRSQLLPCLGSEEQQDSMIARLQNTKGDEQDRDTWEGEKGRLLKLFQLLQNLNKDLIDITTRCKQYQKG